MSSRTNGRSQENTPGRRLGDEWAEWKETAPQESAISETAAIFSFLCAFMLVLMFATAALSWYLVKPRIAQITPAIVPSIEWSLLVFLTVSTSVALIEISSLLRVRRSILPYRFVRRLLLFLLPGALWLGARLGLSKDRIGNSFVKANNLLLISHPEEIDTERLLMLLPRCLSRDARACIAEKTRGSAARVITVAGGEEARAAIARNRPTLILALACERDLMSGMRDVAAEQITVLALPNRRPQGPCRNTDFSIEELDEILRFIANIDRARRTPK